MNIAIYTHCCRGCWLVSPPPWGAVGNVPRRCPGCALPCPGSWQSASRQRWLPLPATGPNTWRFAAKQKTTSAGVADWCNKHLPPNSTLLVHDAGYIAYGTRFKTVDLVGLKTLWAVPYHRDLTFPSDGRKRGEAIDRIARRACPDYLLVLRDWEQIFHIASGLRRRGWRVEELTTERPFIFRIFRITPAGLAAHTDGDLSARFERAKRDGKWALSRTSPTLLTKDSTLVEHSRNFVVAPRVVAVGTAA